MKRMKTILALLALVLLSGAVLATGNLKVNIIPGESEKALVNVASTAQSHLEIEVEDKNGDVVYFKETKTPSNGYDRIYDFSKLDDGIYTFTVKLGKEIEAKTLDIRDGKVKLVGESKTLVPYFAFNNNKLKLSYLNFEKEKVKFYLFDSKTNELVLERNLNSDFAINFGLDFSKVKSGNYDAVLAGANTSYDYEVIID